LEVGGVVRNRQSYKKGAAMLVAIFAGVLLIALSATLLNALNNELKSRKVTEERIVNKYIAEAGIETGIANIYKAFENGFEYVWPEQGLPREQEITLTQSFTIPAINNQRILYNGDEIGKFSAAYSDSTIVFTARVDTNGDVSVVEVNPKQFDLTAEGVLPDGRMHEIKASIDFSTSLDLPGKRIKGYKILSWK
jgi:hypothetical protein